MGRGRAKAKQIKVARKLKYYSPETDLSALQRELGGASTSEDSDDYADDGLYDDPDYSDYADKYADDEDGDDGR
ncbi:DUF3073 domain-containing protein [Brevibacterium otitidis]|uniref:DUF3073 domain-containing protein n=1 Tax=Brevibacterium otitidis TaxID=53364 RepID=A0ABV5WZB7_9MICO|nr:hypothetical protein GCM10023233_02310 [Brevibacterium otitidis]